MTRENKELVEVLEKIATRLDWIADSLQEIASGETIIQVATRTEDETPTYD